MCAATIPSEQSTLTLHFGPVLNRLSDHEFFEFCQANPELRLERTSDGDLIIMPPTGGDTGRRNFILTGQFWIWINNHGTGVAFDSSTGFTLPNGAKRSPDLAWVQQERWDALTEVERNEFPPLCPDFVVELRSPTDRLNTLQEKMQEYIENGAQLGWLIDPNKQIVYIYRPDQNVDIQTNLKTLSGDPVLPGFVLDVQRLWI